MLVFQRDWKHIEDGCKRAGIETKWLLEIVAETNLYLPEDWRLTRSNNNFIIQIVSRRHTPALIGTCYLLDNDNMLHVIDTIFLKGWFDKYDVQTAMGQYQGKITLSKKKKHPEIIIPNLYFFRPCPDNSISPLFARQYEKIKEDKDGEAVGDQYHRIHPLTKAGLDIEHFRWILWKTNGDISFTDTVNTDYHGKDYWMVPSLEADRKRGTFHTYQSNYRSLLQKYGITQSQTQEKLLTAYETEYKFTVPGTQDDAYCTFQLVNSIIETTDITITDNDNRAKKQVDTYFDDDDFSLHAAGTSFRVRNKKTGLCITLKKRFPAKKENSQKELYQRIEEEAIISFSQKNELLSGKPLNTFPYRLISYTVPDCGKLKPRVIVRNKRKTLYLRDRQYLKAELHLDSVIYEIEGKAHGPYFEIEIESKGTPLETIEKLAGNLEKKLGLMPSRQSKYERGISLLQKN